MKQHRKEQIVIVDEHDRVLGEEDKEKCHDGEGILHRAFLAMVFNRAGELLLTRRSGRKRLWPGFWDGSVASHVFEERGLRAGLPAPAPGGTGDRRSTTIEYAFKFRYKAALREPGHRARDLRRHHRPGRCLRCGIRPDPDEIDAVRTADLKVLIEEIRGDGAAVYALADPGAGAYERTADRDPVRTGPQRRVAGNERASSIREPLEL